VTYSAVGAIVGSCVRRVAAATVVATAGGRALTAARVTRVGCVAAAAATVAIAAACGRAIGAGRITTRVVV
jgi:hypothetical protein